MNPTLQYAIVCDTVRQEVSGKHIFVGVYNDTIAVRKMPATVRLSVAVGMAFSDMGDSEILFRSLLDEKPVAGQVRAEINVAQAGPAILGIPFPAVKLEADGKIQFQWKLVGGDWETIASINVTTRSADINPPTASPPPSSQSPRDAS